MLLNISALYAQWDPQISQYWAARPLYNPAFTGESDSIQISLLDRQQWVGMDGAPKTLLATVSTPFNFMGRRHGGGFMLMTETIGLFSNTTISGQYAYKKTIKKNVLDVGLQINISTLNFDASKIHIPDAEGFSSNDEAIPQSMSEAANVFDASLGVSWRAPQYYIGLSASHLWEPAFELDEQHSTYLPRTYYFTTGCNISFKNSLIELLPSLLLKSDLVVTQFELTARARYNKMFNGGLSYRWNDGFIVSLGIAFRSIEAGYAFDLSTSAIMKAANGSHELYLRYSLPIDLSAPNKNKYKSVRLL
jgi:type IX secretion system PorP/SprF family membrane protein